MWILWHHDTTKLRHQDTATPRKYDTTTLQHHKTTTPRHHETTIRHHNTMKLRHNDTATPRHHETTMLRHCDTMKLQHHDTATPLNYATTTPCRDCDFDRQIFKTWNVDFIGLLVERTSCTLRSVFCTWDESLIGKDLEGSCRDLPSRNLSGGGKKTMRRNLSQDSRGLGQDSNQTLPANPGSSLNLKGIIFLICQ
jgi:hypothetical protein